MAPRFQLPRGTQDVLPEDQPHWDLVSQTARRLCATFGYGQLQTPMFEDAALFARGVGEVTDIVQKEMYIFKDRGGQDLALRPEGTAPICRAYLEHGMHNLPQPVRLWYWAPAFRYDRPQAGRYRQHHQFGAEAIGDSDSAVDAEIIELLWRLYEEIGLQDISLNLNSIGDGNCRPQYLDRLRDFYRDKLDKVCVDCRQRFELNPLRLLDCKQERCQPVIVAAPPMTAHLCDDCGRHFDDLRTSLAAAGISFDLNPRLVRGLDYYTRTVFEFQPREEGGQSTIGGGGRYDGLIEELGGRPTPGIGFGTGVERIILNLRRQNIAIPEPARPHVFVVSASAAARVAAVRLGSNLRRNGIPAIVASGERSLKAQLRHADALGVAHAAIIGERELSADTVTLKRLADGEQQTVPTAEVAQRVTPSAPA